MKALRFLRALALAFLYTTLLGHSGSSYAAQGTGCMPTTGTVSGLSFAQAVNAGIAALISNNSGASAPATDCSAAAVKGQVWLDTSVTPNVERRYDGTQWVAVGAVDTTNHVWAPPVGGGSATVTAATTTDICASPAALQTISGVTTIVSFGSNCVVGQRKTLIFDSATPITYNASSMILPGQRDFTAAPGDLADALYLGSGNWRVAISRIDGSSVTNPAIPLGTTIFGLYGTLPPKTVYGAGQALSRATYPDYFLAVTRAQTGTLTSGNNTITSVGNTAGLGAGMPIEGTGIQAGTVISSVTSSTIVMSQTATANGSQTVRVIITGYGSGGDSTTIGVQDCRGRMLAGRDDMNGSPQSRLTQSYFGAQTGSKPTVLAATGGDEKQSLLITQLPATPFSSILGVSVPSQVMSVPIPVRNMTNIGGSTDAAQVSLGNDANANAGALNVSVTYPGATASISGNLGSGAAHPIVPPTSIAECVVVVLP